MRTIDILIAEDDENDRFLVSRAFAKNAQDLSLTFACDGQEAIDCLQSAASAILLLLDLKMPRLDGFQVLEWLAANRANRPDRVVVLSSSVDPNDMERTRALGADFHLTKPHDSRDYVRIARSLLDQAGVSRSNTVFAG
jgi:CheY-like chemotaxis protein